MLELFNQYVPIHCQEYDIKPHELLLQVTGDGYALISCDFFSFGGEQDDVMKALENAVSNKVALNNQCG